ncbi:MAG: hypothetical protein QMC67_11745 [Candidatus Wallbacteria bacterium]
MLRKKLAGIFGLTLLSAMIVLNIQGCTGGGAGGAIGIAIENALNKDEETNSNGSSSYATQYDGELIATGIANAPNYALGVSETASVDIYNILAPAVIVATKTITATGKFSASNLAPGKYIGKVKYKNYVLSYPFSIDNKNYQLINQIGFDRSNTSEILVSHLNINYTTNIVKVVSVKINPANNVVIGNLKDTSEVSFSNSSTESELKSTLIQKFSDYANGTANGNKLRVLTSEEITLETKVRPVISKRLDCIASYVNLNTGNRWSYKITYSNNSTQNFITTVSGTETKNSKSVYALTGDEYASNNKTYYLADVTNGFLKYGTDWYDGGSTLNSQQTYSPELPLVKWDLEQDAAFNSTETLSSSGHSPSTSSLTGTIRCEKIASVIIGEKTYNDCLKVTVTTAISNTKSTQTYWYSRNIGLIKKVTASGTIELVTYTPCGSGC